MICSLVFNSLYSIHISIEFMFRVYRNPRNHNVKPSIKFREQTNNNIYHNIQINKREKLNTAIPL